MSRWPRRFARLFIVLGGVMIAAPMSMAVAQTADIESTIGFFEVSGQSAGIGIEFGNPDSATGYPVVGLVPSASSTFSGGPAGRAVSSIAWPGDLVANAGTLASLVGVPLPPDVLANANYPVKAEASASGGARDEQSLGAMTAIVTEKDAVARTALSDFSSPAVVSASRIVTKTRSFEDGGQAGSIAETEMNGVEIAAGLVKIDTVLTIAKAVSDGTTATLEQSVTVSGVTVGGQAATIDESGMHFGPSSNPNPLDAPVAGFNEGFAEAGFEAFVTKPVDQTSEGGAGSVSSGAVVFVWTMGDAGNETVVTLGGSRARVQATPGSALDLGTDLDSLTGAGDFGSGSADLGSFSAPVDLDSTGSFGSPSTGSSGSGGGGSKIVPADAVLGFENVSTLSDRVPIGWMLIGILGMFLVGSGLHGLRAATVTGAFGTACPLERGVM